jgi:hypothetical protein
MTKTKVLDLDELYKFVVDNFFIWNHLLSLNFVWSSHILKFKFWIIQTKSDREMTKTRIVDLNKFYNFVADNFFYLNLFTILKCCLKLSYFENLNF